MLISRIGEIQGQSYRVALDDPFGRLRALIDDLVSGLDFGAAPGVAPDNLGAGIGAGHRRFSWRRAIACKPGLPDRDFTAVDVDKLKIDLYHRQIPPDQCAQAGLWEPFPGPEKEDRHTGCNRQYNSRSYKTL